MISTKIKREFMLTLDLIVFSSHLFNANAKALGLMPFFHSFGLILMLLALCEGTLFVIMDRFNLQNFLDITQNYKVFL
jgi:acyl-CoA synthetase (AMP-forming)/AMP-acid ligase II